MPNIKSAKKRVIIAELNRQRNASAKSRIKTQLRKFNEAVSAGNKELAAGELQESVSLLDKGASKGFIHKNTGARKKSALYKLYNQM